MPITILAPELAVADWLPVVAVLSMGPLLYRDGLMLATCAVVVLWMCFTSSTTARVARLAEAKEMEPSALHAQKTVGSKLRACLHTGLMPLSMEAAVAITAAGLGVFALVVRAPARYPFIVDAAVTCSCCAFISASFVQLYYELYRSTSGRTKRSG